MDAQPLRLPPEIEEEILSRLPVKSLLRFRCVSKPWGSLIGSKRFIKSHLQNYTIKQHGNYDHSRVILHCHRHGLNHHGPTQSNLRSYKDEPLLEPTPVHDPKNNLIPGIVVGQCNGILCIYKQPRFFFLWNPATRISIELPEIDRQGFLITTYGFGCDERSGAYKVFVVLFGGSFNRVCQVYSTKTNSWRRFENLLYFSWLYPDGSLWGKFHWLSNPYGNLWEKIDCLMKSGQIETFDWMSKVYGVMPEDGDSMLLFEKEGCPAIVTYKNEGTKRKFYYMVDCGVKESWVDRISEPDDDEESSRRRRCCKAFVYVESLVSPVLEDDCC